MAVKNKWLVEPAILIQLRKRAGLTRRDVAQHLGRVPETIAKWERGEYTPTVEVQKELITFIDGKLPELELQL